MNRISIIQLKNEIVSVPVEPRWVPDVISSTLRRMFDDRSSSFVLREPSACQQMPVGLPEVGAAECITDRVDGAVDVTQPVTCNRGNGLVYI